MNKHTLAVSLLLPILLPLSAQQHSELWGEKGEKWDPQTSRLADFSNVGYLKGAAPIPDWPVGVNVQDFGAVPDDDIDDSQAFIDAIAACPEKHAVLAPRGRYIILRRIQPERDFFVLRGGDMYETVLFFPKYLNEIEIQEIGYDPANPRKRHIGAPKGFFRVEEGTHRSIENLTFEFREQIKRGHWEHKGASAIFYGKKARDSWVRNIVFRNTDNTTSISGSYLSFINIVFDHFIGRPDIVGSSGRTRWVGHIGIGMNGASHCLFHNIVFTGKFFHDFDIINVPGHNVVSNVRGDDVTLHHHGMGARHNLYTNVDVGAGPGVVAVSPKNRQKAETHWRIYGDGFLDPGNVEWGAGEEHVFVGYGVDVDSVISPDFHHERIDPAELAPQNIYLAQLAFHGKPLPAESIPAPPPRETGDVVRVNPVDDLSTDHRSPDEVVHKNTLPLTGDAYLKFDLRGLDLRAVERARLRITAARINRPPLELGVFPVENDGWSEQTLTHNTRPDAGGVLDTRSFAHPARDLAFEFDVTPFVKSQWAGDGIVSLTLGKVSGNGFPSWAYAREAGRAPELVIEQVPDPVPGPPSAPEGIRSFSAIGNIKLDWEDSPESDVATYKVYRTTTPSDTGSYGIPVGMGLIYSEFEDIQHNHDGGWDVGMLRGDTVYFYQVTAVDRHGNESERSGVVRAAPLGPEGN